MLLRPGTGLGMGESGLGRGPGSLGPPSCDGASSQARSSHGAPIRKLRCCTDPYSPIRNWRGKSAIAGHAQQTARCAMGDLTQLFEAIGHGDQQALGDVFAMFVTVRTDIPDREAVSASP